MLGALYPDGGPRELPWKAKVGFTCNRLDGCMYQELIEGQFAAPDKGT